MKCPKCQYIGFEGHTRCRHCGYDLSLSATTEVTPGDGAPNDTAADQIPDVIYRPEPSARAQARAAIQKRAASRTPSPESFDLPLFATPGIDDRPALPASRPPLSVRRPADAPRARAAAAAAFAPAPAQVPPPGQANEPLAPGEEPLAPMALGLSLGEAEIQPRADSRLELEGLALGPRPDPGNRGADAGADPDLSFTVGGTPLGGALRAGGGALILPGREASASASAGFARVRPGDADEAATLDGRDGLAFRDGRPDLDARAEVEASPVAADAATLPSGEPDGSAAPLGPRMLAGLLDIAVLVAVDAAVVLATLRATDVDVAQVDRLPLAPLAVFLVLLAIGYLSMCTVLAGRTFGKAVFGLAVVEPGGRPVRLAPAVVRALMQVLTVPAAGIGFLPALLGADRRSLYDRLAGTDVVRDPRAVEDTRPE
jgi:uncharacterized RDD family membrane protein YckC